MTIERLKKIKNHMSKLYNLPKMKGLFRACSHNSVLSNFLEYHKLPDSMHILQDEHFIDNNYYKLLIIFIFNYMLVTG